MSENDACISIIVAFGDFILFLERASLDLKIGRDLAKSDMLSSCFNTMSSRIHPVAVLFVVPMTHHAADASMPSPPLHVHGGCSTNTLEQALVVCFAI